MSSSIFSLSVFNYKAVINAKFRITLVAFCCNLIKRGEYQ